MPADWALGDGRLSWSVEQGTAGQRVGLECEGGCSNITHVVNLTAVKDAIKITSLVSGACLLFRHRTPLSFFEFEPVLLRSGGMHHQEIWTDEAL